MSLRPRVRAGSFGEVFRGIWRGTEVAVKLLLEQDLSPDNMDDFCNEISLLSRLRHPNGARAAPCPMTVCLCRPSWSSCIHAVCQACVLC